MTKTEFKTIQKETGFTNQKMAQFLNVSIRTIQSWLQGVRKIDPERSDHIRLKVFLFSNHPKILKKYNKSLDINARRAL